MTAPWARAHAAPVSPDLEAERLAAGRKREDCLLADHVFPLDAPNGPAHVRVRVTSDRQFPLEPGFEDALRQAVEAGIHVGGF